MNDISNQVIAALRKKSVVVVCPDSQKRMQIVDHVYDFMNEKPTSVYRFSDNLKTDEAFLKHTKKMFPLVSPLGVQKAEMTFDQVEDIQLDWVKPGKDVVVILPELHVVQQKSPSFFRTILNTYLTRAFNLAERFQDRTCFRFLVTVENLPDALMEGFELYVGRSKEDSRSMVEIARTHIEVLIL